MEDDILGQVLGHIRLIRDDKLKLQKILDFILQEIYEEEQEPLPEIPEKFEKLLKPIAQSIDAGFMCYLNPETLNMEEIPKTLMDEPYAYEMISGINPEDEELKHEQRDECYVFEPLCSNESFEIMETFAKNIKDEKFSGQLFYALNHRKPFANFKWKIDNSPYRQDWFDFKQKWLEGYVRKVIWSEINKIEGIGGTEEIDEN